MNLLRRPILPLILAVTSACSPSPAEPVAVVEPALQATPPASTPDPVAARVDALIADTRAREAAVKEADRLTAEQAAAAARAIRVVTEYGRPTAAAPSPQGASAADGTPTPAPVGDLMGDGSRVVRDEAWWRREMNRLRDQLGRDEAACYPRRELVNRLSRLLDVTATATSAAVVASDVIKARSDLRQCEMAVQVDLNLIAIQEEDARRHNVPPGWLRR